MEKKEPCQWMAKNPSGYLENTTSIRARLEERDRSYRLNKRIRIRKRDARRGLGLACVGLCEVGRYRTWKNEKRLWTKEYLGLSSSPSFKAMLCGRTNERTLEGGARRTQVHGKTRRTTQTRLLNGGKHPSFFSSKRVIWLLTFFLFLDNAHVPFTNNEKKTVGLLMIGVCGASDLVWSGIMRVVCGGVRVNYSSKMGSTLEMEF